MDKFINSLSMTFGPDATQQILRATKGIEKDTPEFWQAATPAIKEWMAGLNLSGFEVTPKFRDWVLSYYRLRGRGCAIVNPLRMDLNQEHIVPSFSGGEGIAFCYLGLDAPPEVEERASAETSKLAWDVIDALMPTALWTYDPETEVILVPAFHVPYTDTFLFDATLVKLYPPLPSVVEDAIAAVLGKRR